MGRYLPGKPKPFRRRPRPSNLRRRCSRKNTTRKNTTSSRARYWALISRYVVLSQARNSTAGLGSSPCNDEPLAPAIVTEHYGPCLKGGADFLLSCAAPLKQSLAVCSAADDQSCFPAPVSSRLPWPTVLRH